MEKTRQIFDTQQEQVLVCGSGRVMIALNEEKLKTTEQVPVAMDEDGTMEYETREKMQYAYDVYWLPLPSTAHDAASVLSAAKASLLSDITAYDTSSSVNGFVLNGMLIPWSKNDPNSPNVEKRMGLRQNIADKVALGEENIAIWLKGMSFTMPCVQAEALMRSIENYAYECFNVTAAHKKAVTELDNIEAVLTYDYRAGYPKMLEMSV